MGTYFAFAACACPHPVHRHVEAEALDGVVAVATGADCKVPFGVLPISENEFPLAREKVRYRGDPVAVVAAIDEATAVKALKLIRAPRL